MSMPQLILYMIVGYVNRRSSPVILPYIVRCKDATIQGNLTAMITDAYIQRIIKLHRRIHHNVAPSECSATVKTADLPAGRWTCHTTSESN